MYEQLKWQFELDKYIRQGALVRTNYNDLKNNVHADAIYLEKFFGNLLLGEGHELIDEEVRLSA